MNQQKWTLTAAMGIVFSYLFTSQDLGWNVFAFNIAYWVGMSIVHYRTMFYKHVQWYLSAFSLLSIGLSYGFYGFQFLSFLFWPSLFVNAYLFIYPDSSPIPAFLQVFITPIQYFIQLMNRLIDPAPSKNIDGENVSTPKKQNIWALPVFGLFIFILLYRLVSPTFMSFTDELVKDFDISFWHIWSFFLGVFIFFWLLSLNINAWIYQKDKSLSNTTVSLSKDELELSKEKNKLHIQRGTIFFILINLLTALVNIMDFVALNAQSTDVTFSEKVHQGITGVILSVLLAMGIIVYFYKNEIKHLKEIAVAKTLTYLWMIQKIIMILFVVIANQIYIDELGLTYKRIGVYIYLLIVVFGIISTVYKLAQNYSSYWLVRFNSWSVILILSVYTLFPWTYWIAQHHLNHPSPTIGDIDYLNSYDFDDMNLPEILLILEKKEIQKNYTEYTVATAYEAEEANKKHYLTLDYKLEAKHRYQSDWYRFLQNKDYHNKSWRSSNSYHASVYDKLASPEFAQNFKSFYLNDLSNINLENPLIKNMAHAEFIDFSSNTIKDLNFLKDYNKLTTLDISYCTIENIDQLFQTKSIKTLVVYGWSEETIETLKTHLPTVSFIY